MPVTEVTEEEVEALWCSWTNVLRVRLCRIVDGQAFCRWLIATCNTNPASSNALMINVGQVGISRSNSGSGGLHGVLETYPDAASGTDRHPGLLLHSSPSEKLPETEVHSHQAVPFPRAVFKWRFITWNGVVLNIQLCYLFC